MFANTDNEDPDRAEIKQQYMEKMLKAREEAKARKLEIQQDVKEKRAQIKMDVCERRQEHLSKMRPHLAQGATSVKKAIDKVYDRVVGFYESGQLTVENYEELVANIEAAKAAAEEAQAAVASYTFEIDCENPKLGEQLDGYRMVVKEAKNSLKEYRKALVELIKSMRAAAAVENSSGQQEGGDE